jgi:hypothetical protein
MHESPDLSGAWRVALDEGPKNQDVRNLVESTQYLIHEPD